MAWATVRTMLADGAGHLFVGGEFLYAGGRPHHFLLRPTSRCWVAASRTRRPPRARVAGLPSKTAASANLIASRPLPRWQPAVGMTYELHLHRADRHHRHIRLTAPMRFYRAVTP